jgi:hypothetical protein
MRSRCLRVKGSLFNLRRTMRGFAAHAISLALVLLIAKPAEADGLSREESIRLSRGETVIREQTLERGDHRWVGGVTYTVVDAGSSEVGAVLEDAEALARLLPRTKEARRVGTYKNGVELVELAHGNAIVEAKYTILVRRTPNEIRFWMDPSRPHGIDDAWGFFRLSPFVSASGEERVLLTYGILVDVGPGIVRELFEERVRAAMLSVPQLVRRQVADARRPVP